MEPEKKTNGALVGLVVIIIILIVGGVYIWFSNRESVSNNTGNTQTESTGLTDQDAAALNSLELEAETTNTNTEVDVETLK